MGKAGAIRRRDVGLACTAVVLLAALTYLPSLRNGFAFDDSMVIVESSYLLSRPELLPELFGREYFELSGESTYRPVTTLTYMLDWQIGGGEAWAFHLQSVAWHLLAVGLALTLFRRVGFASAVSIGAAVLIAVHPVLTEAVDGVSFREDVLATVLGLGSLLLLVRSVPGMAASVGGGILLLLALLSKESAISFVGLLPLTWGLQAIRSNANPRRFVAKRRAGLLAAGTAAGLFVLLRFVVFPTSGTYASWPGGSLLGGIGTGCVAVGHYLRLIVLPHPLTADYRGVVAPVTSALDWRPWLVLAVVGSLLGLAWWVRRQAPGIIWGLAWFLIALAPVGGLVPIPVFMAERFVYLPFIGIAVALAETLNLAGRRLAARSATGKRATAVVIVAVVGTLTASTWNRHAAWKSDETLWKTELDHHPTAHGALHGHANALQDRGQYAESIPYLRRALSSETLSAEERSRALGSLGIALGSLGDLQASAAALADAIELQPDPKLSYNLGITYLRMKRYEDGERELRRAIELRSRYAKPYLPLADLLEWRGHTAEAARLRARHEALDR